LTDQDIKIKRIEEKIDTLIAIRTAPRWLSLASAAQYASMSKNTFIKYIQDGKIYATQKGGKWYVDRESIDHFMIEDDVIVRKVLDSFR